jgi:hypothetical protein
MVFNRSFLRYLISTVPSASSTPPLDRESGGDDNRERGMSERRRGKGVREQLIHIDSGEKPPCHVKKKAYLLSLSA